MNRTLTRLGPLLAGLSLFAPAGAEPLDPDAALAVSEDVVILGEVHDNPDHHAFQARAVAHLQPAAIVFEMFGPAEALAAERVPRGDADALADALGWPGSGWPDFAMYHPIFLAAPEARLFGGEVAPEDVRLAASDGAAAAMGGSAPLFGLDAPLDPDEAEQRAALQGSAHCDALPEDVLPGVVEVQRLRDAALARAVVAAFAETGGPVAVITGNGHARIDWGVPRYLARALPDRTVLSIGQIEGDLPANPPFDRWTVGEPIKRDDPCAVFRRSD